MGDISEFAAIDRLSAELAEARAQIAEAERGRLQFRKAYRELRAELAEARAQTNFWENKYTDLEIELRDTRATLRQSLQHRDTLRAELAEARAQIDALDEAHQLHQQGLWQDITELRASCASLRETKDTFFRNAEAWEAKYNEARAQIAELQTNHNKNTQEWMDEVLGLKKQIAANEDERHKIVAALKAKGLGLYPVPDGEGRWHYEVKELDKDAWMTPPRNPNNG